MRKILKPVNFGFQILFVSILSFLNIAMAQNLSSHIHLRVEKYHLSNGLTVLLNPDEKLNTASYILGFKVGSRHERPGLTGISHMFEHLMFKGTKKYPEFNQIYSRNGVVGVNAFTSRDYTAYVGTFPPDKLEFILDVESDRMTELTFTQEELEKERGAVQEERLMAVDNSPSGTLFENLFDLVFQKHPYRWPIIGYSKDISSYTLKDLNNWYRTYYSPNNAVLVISGKFSVGQAKKLIKKYFGKLQIKNIPQEVKVIEAEQEEPRFREINKTVQSSLVAFSYLGPASGTKEFYALEVISQALGAGESSLFYKKLVRQEKLLSSISVGVIDLFYHGIFYIFYPLLDLSKEQEVKIAVLEELKTGLNQALNPRTLEKVKNISMIEAITFLKRSGYRVRILLDYEINFGDYRKMYNKLDLLNEMSPEFIKKVGEKYLSSQRLNYLILKAEK